VNDALSTPYDEAHVAPGVAREHYEGLLGTIARADLTGLRDAAARRIAELGATFGTGHDAGAFLIDPVPRLIAGAEWDALAAGLDQRVRALNQFVVDSYGPRAIVEAGVVDAAIIDGAEGYEPALRGRLPPGAVPVAIAGLDVVRDPAGTFRVLEDNCRAPSGFAYAVALREVTQAVLPVAGPPCREIAGPARELITGVLRDAAPDGVQEPFVVVLTDGPCNLAHWEHARLAGLAGAALLRPGDLERRGHRLHARLPDGRVPRVDVLYRRCDEDRLRDSDGRPTFLAELLADPWTRGTLGLVNGLGTGVADDKLVHASVEAMIGFYLGEEPLLGSVATFDLGRPEALREVLDDLEAFVVKPRGGCGGNGIVVCGHAEPHDLAALRATLRKTPGGFVAQRTVILSSSPTLVDPGCLAPRHVDLRPFTFSGRGWTRTLPGGLTRVAMAEGALVVNSSRDGAAKDTWVLQ